MRVASLLRRAGLVTAALTAIALGACGGIDGAQQVMDRARLVNDLASRLDRAGQLTYTAEYQVPGGARATIAQAQDPIRAAYTYPGGKIITKPDALITCNAEPAPMTCVLTAPPSSPPADPPSSLLSAAGSRVLIPPTEVVGLLTAASLSRNAVISQHDTTIAGEHATCVDVKGVENAPANAFVACVTSAGVLGSFSGTIDGRLVEFSLTRYVASVAENAFDPPGDARIVDHRPRR